MNLFLRCTAVLLLWGDGNTLAPLWRPALGITFSTNPSRLQRGRPPSCVSNTLLEKGEWYLGCPGCENIKAIERTSGTWLNSKLFIALRTRSPFCPPPTPLWWVTHCVVPISCPFLSFFGIYTEQTAMISCWMPSGSSACFGLCKGRGDSQENLRLLWERGLWPSATRS